MASETQKTDTAARLTRAREAIGGEPCEQLTLPETREERVALLFKILRQTPPTLEEHAFQVAQLEAGQKRNRYDQAAAFAAAGKPGEAAAWRAWAENPDLTMEEFTQITKPPRPRSLFGFRK